VSRRRKPSPEPEPDISEERFTTIMNWLMRIDAKIDVLLKDGDDEEE
jgi:hypothetical protein